MKPNVGKFDRVFRIVIGLVLIVAPLINFMGIWSSGGLSYGAMLVGAVLVLTAFVSFCPIYRIVGVSTCKV